MSGPRKVGKTSTVKRCISRLLTRDPAAPILYFDFGLERDARALRAVVRRAKASRPGERWHLFLDGVTNLRGWARAVAEARADGLLSGDYALLTGSIVTPEHVAWRGEIPGCDMVQLPMSFSDFCRCLSPRRRLPDPMPIKRLLQPPGRAAVEAAAGRRDELQRELDAYSRLGGFPEAAERYALSRSARSTWDELFRVHWGAVACDLRQVGAEPETCGRAIARPKLPAPDGGGQAQAALTDPLPRRKPDHPRERLVSKLARCMLAFTLLASDDVTEDARDAGEVRGERRAEVVYYSDPLVHHIPGRLASDAHLADATQVLRSQLAVALMRTVRANTYLAPTDLLRSADGYGGAAHAWWVREAGGQLPRNLLVAHVGDDQARIAAVRAALARDGAQGILITRRVTEASAPHPAIPLVVFLGLLESPAVGSRLPDPG